LGIDLFTNQRTNIFIYYFFTTLSFIAIFSYLVNSTSFSHLYIFLILIFFISIAGFLISKLAVDPLEEYINNLQTFSVETLHELNLPLSTIRTNLGMLYKNNENEKSITRLKRIDTACEMLEQRYNELDYMIKKQSLKIQKESFELSELVQKRVEFLRQIYPSFKFKLELDQTYITSDKIGLSKVIDNLIDNCVKYSNNSTDIDISLKENELFIKDYGCGIDELELVKIFDTYYQSNSNNQGYGIGLSMVKRFCDNNNILLKIDSNPKNGTKVVLKFKDN
jgi:signal transduction histidine kinase